MAVHKQSVSLKKAAFAHAKEMVDRGDYPNVSAAVSGKLARARAARERDQTLVETEVRLQVPVDQWEPVIDAADFTADARTFCHDDRTARRPGHDPDRAASARPA